MLYIGKQPNGRSLIEFIEARSAEVLNSMKDRARGYVVYMPTTPIFFELKRFWQHRGQTFAHARVVRRRSRRISTDDDDSTSLPMVVDCSDTSLVVTLHNFHCEHCCLLCFLFSIVTTTAVRIFSRSIAVGTFTTL